MLVAFFAVVLKQYFFYKYKTFFMAGSVSIIAFIVFFIDYICDNRFIKASIKETIVFIASVYVFSFVPFYLYYHHTQDIGFLIQLMLSSFLLGWLYPWPIYVFQAIFTLIISTLIYSIIEDISAQALAEAAFTLSIYITIVFIVVFILFKKYGSKLSKSHLLEKNYNKKSIAQDRYHSITFDQQDQYNLITLELFLILKHYFIVDISSKSVNLVTNANPELVTTPFSVSDIYKLVFSVTYYLIKISEIRKSINIDINQDASGIIFNFKISNNQFYINEIQKYAKKIQPDPDRGILNWFQISALCKAHDYDFTIKKNEICIKNNIKTTNNIVHFTR
jgi:hypothetical protein